MSEFASLERCAAYVAARGALDAIRDAVAAWPSDLAADAREAAVGTVVTVAEGIEQEPGSAARRRCLRSALVAAVELAATCDVARALGVDSDELDAAQQLAGRSIALLGLLFHANATSWPDDE